MNKKTSTARSIATILLLLILPPVGLLLMWLGTSWNKVVKVIVTIPLLFYSFYYSMGVLSSLNPGNAVRKAQCMNECVKLYPQEQCVKSCASY